MVQFKINMTDTLGIFIPTVPRGQDESKGFKAIL
jgi:hypothetical protein